MKEKKYILFIIGFLLFQISSIYVNVEYIGKYVKIIKLIAIIALLAHILLNREEYKKLNKKILALMIILSIISLFITKQYFFLTLVLLMIIVSVMDHKEVIKLDLKIKFILTTILILLSFIGLTNELTIYRGDNIRYSLGFYHPNLLATYVLIMYFEYIYIKNTLQKRDYMLASVVGIILYIITQSRMAIMALALYLLLMLNKNKITKIIENKKITKIIENLFIIMTVYSVVIVLLHVYSGSKIVYFYDSILSGRTHIQAIFYHRYGFSLIGQYIEYFKSIDNFYYKVLINYGIIGSFVLSGIYKNGIKKILDRKEYIYIVTIICMMIYGYVENTILDIKYNTLMLTMLATTLTPKLMSKESKKIKDKNKLVSIIVPAYNCEKYIAQCIESILNQTYKNIEIIIINDGSTDTTEEKIKFYKDKRIKYHKNKNRGVSETRNYGIKESKGEYICFIDSDDVVSTRYIEDFISNIEDDSYVCCKYKIFTDKITNQTEEKTNVFILDGEQKYDVIYQGYEGYIWNRMYIADIIKNNNILFNSEISMCEDQLFNIEYMLYCQKIVCLNGENYYYRKISQSLSNNFKNPKWFTIFDAYNKMLEHKKLFTNATQRKMYYCLLKNIVEAKYRLKYVDEKEKERLVEKVDKTYKKYYKMRTHISITDKIKLKIQEIFPAAVIEYKKMKEGIR